MRKSKNNPESNKKSNSKQGATENNSLPKKANDVLKQLQRLPIDQQKLIFSRTVNISASYTSGPLPQSTEIKKYDEIIPNGADGIMKMAEKRLSHDTNVLDRESRTDRWISISGQIFGFVVAIVMIIASAYLISIGKEMAGGIFGGTLILGLVSLFLNRGKMNNN
jgi:uncharacterized membrane protein